MHRSKFILISFFFLSCAAEHAQKNSTIFHDSFEDDKMFLNWQGKEACCNYSLKRTDSISIDGKYSARIELRYNDPLVENGKRSELVTVNEATPGVERWYQFSIFLPADYKEDTLSEILAQWHELPDFDLGETWRSPPISLQLNKKEWTLNIMWAKNPVNTNATVSGYKTLKLGDLQTNKWTTWRIHILFSYEPDGIVEVWKNNNFIVKYNGPNYYNDKKGPFFKLGIYKWDWNNNKPSMVKTRVLYIDNVKVSSDKPD